jgi:hypothetical protein
VKKNGAEIFSSMFSSLEKTNNGIKNMNSVYTTAALFCVELFCEDTLFDFVRLIISFQDLALTSTVLSPSQKIHLHVIALSLFTIVAHCLPIVQDYCNKVRHLKDFIDLYFSLLSSGTKLYFSRLQKGEGNTQFTFCLL